MRRGNIKKLYLVLAGLILSVSVLSFPPLFIPSGFTQAMVFRALVALLILLFFIDTLFWRRGIVLPENKKPAVIFIALVVIYLLSSILSSDPLFSLLGDPLRGGGSLNLLLLLIFSLIILSVFDEEDWKKILDISLLVALAVSLIGVFQKQGILMDLFAYQPDRPAATLGNTIHWAVYSQFFFFLSLLLFNRAQGHKKIMYLFTALIFLFSIGISETRAVYLSLASGIVFLLFFHPRINTKIKIALIVLGALSLLSLVWLRYNPEVISKLDAPSIVEDVLTRITENTGSVGMRVSAWKIYVNGVKDHPVLGWGIENLEIPYNKYYDPTLPGMGNEFGGDWWDRAHNTPLDVVLSAGVPALMLYLSLYGVLILKLLKEKKTDPLMLATILITHFISNLTSFDTFSTYLIFFLFITYSIHSTSEDKEEVEIRLDSSLKLIVIGALTVTLLLSTYHLSLKPLYVNRQVNIGEYLTLHGECLRGLTTLQDIEDAGILSHYSRFKFAHSVERCIATFVLGDNIEIPLAYDVLKGLERNTQERPLFIKNWFMMGTFSNFILGKTFESGGDESLEIAAESWLEKAQELAPQRTDLMAEHARFYNMTQEYDKALEETDRCLELKPDQEICWYQKGLAEIGLRRDSVDSFINAEEHGYKVGSVPSLIEKVRIYGSLTPTIEVYTSLKDIYLSLIKMEPRSPQWRASLAFVYKELGDTQSARQQALELLKLSPESKGSVEEFLKSL